MVPPDVHFATCDNAEYASWTGATRTGSEGGVRYQQGAGQHDLLWLLDVDGVRLVVDPVFYDETSQAALDELDAIFRSIRIDLS